MSWALNLLNRSNNLDIFLYLTIFRAISVYANSTTNIFISISKVCKNLTVEVFSLGSKQYAAASIKIKYDYDITGIYKMFKSQNCCPKFHQLYYLINMLISSKLEQLTVGF